MGKTLPHPSKCQIDVILTEEKLVMLTMQKHPVSSAWRESQDTEVSLLPTPHPKRKLDIHLYFIPTLS